METLYLKLQQMFIPKIKLSEENVYIKRKGQEITQQTFYQQIENTYKLWNQKNWNLQIVSKIQSWLFFLILLSTKGTGFFKTVTLTLFQTSGKVGSVAIFSATFMSSGRTEPKTVYSCFHSEWSAKLIKNSGPGPIKATEPLLRIGQSSTGSLLNGVPCASNVPWINANGGPKPACKIRTHLLSSTTTEYNYTNSIVHYDSYSLLSGKSLQWSWKCYQNAIDRLFISFL